MLFVNNINKTYYIPKQKKGILSSLKGVFSREYEAINALDNITFAVQQSESVGYLGLNGSGKSTTIKILCGVIKPTAGSVNINNHIPYLRKSNFLRQIGVLYGQRSQLWWDLPVMDSFQLLGAIYHVDKKTLRKRIGVFQEIFALDDIIKTPVRNLSLGQRMRAEIAATMLHQPKILFLDEPTIGLDILAKQNLRAFIRQSLEANQFTLFLTTHDMADVEAICKRVIVIHEGVIIFDGTTQNLKQRFGSSKTITFHLATPTTIPKNFAVQTWQQHDAMLSLRLEATQTTLLAEITKHILQYTPIIDMTSYEASLEDAVTALLRTQPEPSQ